MILFSIVWVVKILNIYVQVFIKVGGTGVDIARRKALQLYGRQVAGNELRQMVGMVERFFSCYHA